MFLLSANSEADALQSVLKLLGLHVALGFVASFFSQPGPTFPTGVFLSLIFSQLCLIGIWGGLSRRFGLWLRLMLVVFGVVAISLETGFGLSGADQEIFVVCSIPALLMLLVAFAVRFFARLQWVTKNSQAVQDALQFTIYHVLILTTVAAALLGLGRVLGPYFRMVRLSSEIATIGICFGATGIVALWATVGNRLHFYRCVLIFAIGGANGWIIAQIVSNGGSEDRFWLGVALAQALWLTLSLLVVRTIGYRLVRS